MLKLFSIKVFLLFALSGPLNADQLDKTNIIDPSIFAEKHIKKLTPGALKKLNQGALNDLLVIIDTPTQIANKYNSKKLRSMRRNSVKTKLATKLKGLQTKFGTKLINIKKRYAYLPIAKIELKNSTDLAALLSSEDIIGIAEDEKLYTNLTQSLPIISQPDAFNADLTGLGQTIAIIDTGLNYTLSSFGNCTAPGSPTSCKVANLIEIAPDDNSLDDQLHGTLVSGVVTGVAPGAKLIGLDVFDGSSARTSDILSAIDWMIDNRDTYNITAANFSLGSSSTFTSACDTPLNPFRDAFEELVTHNIFPVAASGNNASGNGISNPACLTNAYSVGAVYDANIGVMNWPDCSDSNTSKDLVACFSNSASFLDLLAPGALITAAGYQGGGTSLAAPHVAGAVAIIREHFQINSVADIKLKLQQTNTLLTDSKNGLTHPRLDLYTALSPVNNQIGGADMIEDISIPWSGSSQFTSVETDEPGGLSNSVWYQLSTSSSGLFQILLSSEYSQQINIYIGDPNHLSDLTLLASGSNDEAFVFNIENDISYYIQVGSNSVPGPFTVSLSPHTESDLEEEIPILPLWGYLLLSGIFIYARLRS